MIITGLDHVMHPYMPTDSAQPVAGFASMGLAPAILSVLNKEGFTTPTPIQAAAIPVVLQGRDVIGIAQTGTGKTLAFALPIIQKMLSQQGRALVLVPTRELALQVQEGVERVVRDLRAGIRTVCLIGGEPAYRQVRQLRTGPRMIIATPGRLIDLLDQKEVRLDEVRFLVMDEADRMLDMGFIPQIRRIVEQLPTDRQSLLFSATMPAEIAALVHDYQKSPERIEVARAGSSAELIAQELCYVPFGRKNEVLEKLLGAHKGTALVFARTRRGAARLAKQLHSMGHNAAEIHSDRSLGQRKAALDGFKSGRYRVLVATDIAARGIDVRDIGLVVNYDLPDVSEDYVHRIGRTGRAGKSGVAVSLATPDQYKDVLSIERLIRKPLPISAFSVAEPDKASMAASGSKRHKGNRGVDHLTDPRRVHQAGPHSGAGRGSESDGYQGSRQQRDGSRDASKGAGGNRYGSAGGGQQGSRNNRNNRNNRKPERDALAHIPISDTASGFFMRRSSDRD